MTTKWEYCLITVQLYRDGTGGGTRELLSITRPGEQPTGITNPLGLAGLLNELGAEGWELVDVENGTFYLKRPVRSHFTSKPVSTPDITALAGSVEQFNGEKRVNYFDGQRLSADDFTTEQRYSRDMRYLHNHLLHGWGIVSGLDVNLSSDRSAPAVIVEPGLAIDCYGRELIVKSAISMALTANEASLYLILAYRERGTDPVPVLPEATAPAFSRVEEGVTVFMSASHPAGDAIVLANLLRRDDRTWTCLPG